MSAAEPSGVPAASDHLVRRFGRGSRWLHWAHACAFFLLLASGLSLLIPEVKGLNLFGQRLASMLHVAGAAVFVFAPPAIYVQARDRHLIHRDVRRLFAFGRCDVPWLRYAVLAVLGFRAPQPATAKFNPGQKLNAAYTVVVGLGLIATGTVLAINLYRKGVFDVSFVEAVFPLHTILTVASMPVVAIHFYLATLNPGTRESLRGITLGVVRREWAARHHSRWLEDDEDGGASPGPSRYDSGSSRRGY